MQRRSRVAALLVVASLVAGGCREEDSTGPEQLKDPQPSREAIRAPVSASVSSAAQMVFISARDGDPDFEIYLMNADGTALIRLTDKRGVR